MARGEMKKKFVLGSRKIGARGGRIVGLPTWHYLLTQKPGQGSVLGSGSEMGYRVDLGRGTGKSTTKGYSGLRPRA